MPEPRGEHLGGTSAAESRVEQPAAASPVSLSIYRSDAGGKAGGKAESQPEGMRLPKVRHGLAPEGLYLHKWVREIIDRQGTAEELVHTAIKRVTEHHSEERILDAQGILNELGRTGKHAGLFKLLVVRGTIRVLLKKGG